ncbi:MAG: hypothetical protein KKI08_04215 [Armatimonadetes bacterium]|nr:hypothetical protein [Armatimonadota bacterium]
MKECRTTAYQRNGYWYRSKREGDRVVTEYLGRRSWVQAVVELDDLERQQRQAEQARARAEREAALELDREIDRLGDLTREITGAVLVVSGYRSHKRQWRKQRHGRPN